MTVIPEAIVPLGLVPPPPGLPYLARRLGGYASFLSNLVDEVERTVVDGALLGAHWDLRADPWAATLAQLWAFVAEGVSAYTELTANEAYLGTALDWMNVRRLADLLGYRPSPRVAAQAWVQVDVDRAADPLVPAGTRVQAPALPPARPASQTFEVIEDTQLHGDWAGLTATWLPDPATPGRTLRLPGDPGLRAGDRVLLLAEAPAGSSMSAKPLALAKVLGITPEVGYTAIQLDRDLGSLMPDRTASYAAYPVRATAGSARHLSKVLRLPPPPNPSPSNPPQAQAGEFVTLPPQAPYGQGPPGQGPPGQDPPAWIVVDAALDDVSAGQLVALVDWTTAASRCDVVTLAGQVPVEWEVAPGTPVRVSKLVVQPFERPPTLSNAELVPLTVYVLDRRLDIAHVELQRRPPTSSGLLQLRLYPAPAVAPSWVAVQTQQAAATGWEVVRCQPVQGKDGAVTLDSGGLLVGLPDGLVGTLGADDLQAPATANVVKVHHGRTSGATLGSGDASQSGQEMVVPDAPVAYDLDAGGNPVPTLRLRVDGLEWEEVPSLYRGGPSPSFVTHLNQDGGVTLEFGDGLEGARLPTGTNNVAATYRVGGGLAGNVADGAIDSLIGSVRGIRKVTGAGAASGGADQDDEASLRIRVPGRARAFDRAVSLEDLADLALGYPGVSHAVAWVGARPGCACGRSGLHLAFLRAADGVPRVPQPAELASLASFLDGRRDTRIPLCTTTGDVTPVVIEASLAVDARRDPATVGAAARAALGDFRGGLGPAARTLGEPIVPSKVQALLHRVPGVVGVTGLAMRPHAVPQVYELLVAGSVDQVVVAP